MRSKNKIFDIPFIGYDYGKNHGWNFDVLVGKYGNPVIGIKIKNAVEQYSADPKSYIDFHDILNQVISIIGENHIIQKLDIFRKQKYAAEKSTHFLQQKYSEHFEGRVYKTIDTLLLFTDVVDNKKKKNNYDFSENRYKELINRCRKVHILLSQYHCEPQFLYEKDWEYYIGGILAMNISDIPTFDNIKSTNTHLRFGERYGKVISFVDVENIELPNQIEPYSILGGSGVAWETAVDNFSFINELDDYHMIVYNQIISIPKQILKQRELEKKKKRHEGVAKSAPSNSIIAEEIDLLLNDIALNGQLLVDAHFSIVFACDNQEKMEKTQSMIESKLFTKKIIVSKNAYNQFELYRSAIPGNAVELKDYDLFTTTSEASLCFFFKESLPISEDSNIYLRFTDRQGVPLKVDLSDLPMKAGRMNNRNKFVLGPSGSGKSFLMNNIVEQYLLYNYDVVIVDTGDSYNGTCSYKGGKYIKYTEEKPITMNPFLMNEKEFNIEKIEFLTNLIFMIWQGANATMTKEQKAILDNTLVSYYHQYFNQGKAWYETKTNEELLLHLEKYNIHKEELLEDFENDLENNKTYYEILGVSFDAPTSAIKEKGRKMINFYHPDKNMDNPNYDKNMYYKIFEAYNTLTNEKKRKEYNETQLVLITRQGVIKSPKNTEQWSEAFRYALIKRIKQLDEKLEVSELSFNSFYEYCDTFLPIYLRNKKYNITEKEFNLRTFLFVLNDFYKAGRYGTILNENADNSLFDEPFIVFEIDNVKDNPTLFPIVTLIIMDTFIQKMRLRNQRRKALIIEEAWKAIASKLMGGYILYLYKTVRKFWGETIVVTQELDDIIGNTVVKDSIISNSDTFILLDQSKFKDSFGSIAEILSLNKVEQNKIWTINNLNNKSGRARFKEFYLKRGSKGEVYGNEVSLEQYLTYTTEKPEKLAVEYYVNGFSSYDEALDRLVSDLKRIKAPLDDLILLINFHKKPINDKVLRFYNHIKREYSESPIKIIQEKIKKINTELEAKYSDKRILEAKKEKSFEKLLNAV